jgi:DNA-binding transcriptional MerR regulator
MRIGQLSTSTGASVRAIRHYEGAGLVRAVRRPNGYREFDAGAVPRVRAIRELMEAGFTVEEVRSLADCLEACPRDRKCSARTLALYRARLARVEGQIRTLSRLQRRLAERVATLGAGA